MEIKNKNLTKLQDTKHMFEWFAEKPFEHMLESIEAMYQKQEPSAKLISFEATSTPDWLNGGKETADNKMILVRSGVAFACEFVLQDDNGTYPLKGILTWIAVDMETIPRTNMWLDLDGTMEQFGSEGALKLRIYELELDE